MDQHVQVKERSASLMNRIFDDDPNAGQMLKDKLAKLETEKAYWKSLKQEPRTFQANETDGMKRCYMLPNLNQQINGIKKRIIEIESRESAGIKLIRKTTFKNGRKVFWYDEEAKN